MSSTLVFFGFATLVMVAGRVSRGTGFWGPPMRALAPAEITRIVLTA